MGPQGGEQPSSDPQIPMAALAQAEAAAKNNTIAETSAETGKTVAGKDSDQNSPHSNPSPSKNGDNSTDQEAPIEQRPPPLFSDEYGKVDFNQDGFNTRAKVASDGRLDISINQKSQRLSDLLVPALRSQLNIQQDEPAATYPAHDTAPTLIDQKRPPPINVVIHVVGSRGDVQPFIALGKVLREQYGHRVRLATHSTFKAFVEDNGLEYFDIGGDPAELMAFMVKNPGLMPGMDTLKSGDVGRRRKGMYEILQGCWRSCFEVGDGTGPASTDDPAESRTSFDSGIGMESNLTAKPFVADAIIANPPSFAHVHCAEKLGIPLHLMFTMPWSPTQAFPHPLANIQSSNADASLTNFISYALVEIMTWQGLGDMINRFREKNLGLEPVSLMWAPGMATRLQIPYTYCWSPALIPKPKDWGAHITLSGFYFLSLASTYVPEHDLETFLNAGPPPVYIGFGSIVVDDPNSMTSLIFDAVRKTGQRALVSKGWGGLGANDFDKPENVFMLGNVPHDWLFKRVSCVVHHGGAGTTAAGIALGKPTVIVPFFGDQPFWGAMIAKAGAGPKPIPNKELTAQNLAAAILEALKPETLSRAQELGAKIGREDGTQAGAQSFHEKLDVEQLRCSLAPSRTAVWRVKRTQLRLSAFAAATLGNEGLLDFNDLKLYRPREYETEDGPWDPISGGASALLGTACSLLMGFADFPVEILRAFKIAPSNKHDERPQSPQDSSKISSPLRTSVESVQMASDLNLPEAIEGGSGQSQAPGSSAISVDDKLSPTPSKTAQCPPRAMKNALRSSLSRSRSRSQSRQPNLSRADSRTGSQDGRETEHVSLDAAVGAGKGIGRMVGAGVKSPMDFTLGIARGFHNAPKLYGDQSVRQSDKVTGLQSGLKAAGKEFGFGIFDGITGLVTQPVDGAKKEGVSGLVKGFGKGIGGLILKPGAAIWGLPGYTFMGIYKEIRKHFGTSVQNYIIAARTAQGFQEWNVSSREDRLAVISQWQNAQEGLKKNKKNRQQGHKPFHRKHDVTGSPRQHQIEDEGGQVGDASPSLPDLKASTDTDLLTNASDSSNIDTHGPEFEEAIKRSVAETSCGNDAEDVIIERAIRASVAELQSASQQKDSRNALQRAIQASVAEAQRGRDAGRGMNDVNDNEQDTSLQDAIRQSLQQSPPPYTAPPDIQAEDSNDSGIDTDNERDIEHAVAKSRADTSEANKNDPELQTVLELSQQSHRTHMEELARSKAEEEIVLEYVKKQSAIEEEKKSATAGDPPTISLP